jgi:hypothetical protein
VRARRDAFLHTPLLLDEPFAVQEMQAGVGS